MRFLNLFIALLAVLGATDTASARSASTGAALTQPEIFGLPRDSTDWSALNYAIDDFTLHGAGANATFENSRRSSRAIQPQRGAKQAARSSTSAARDRDSLRSVWSMALVTIALVGYQLRRKHRLLRPQRITF